MTTNMVRFKTLDQSARDRFKYHFDLGKWWQDINDDIIDKLCSDLWSRWPSSIYRFVLAEDMSKAKEYCKTIIINKFEKDYCALLFHHEKVTPLGIQLLCEEYPSLAKARTNFLIVLRMVLSQEGIDPKRCENII